MSSLHFCKQAKAHRDVSVIPPHESGNKNKLWILLAAAYGLVNANAELQVSLDSVFTTLGLYSMAQVPRLFVYEYEAGTVILVLIMNVDDILTTELGNIVRKFVEDIGNPVALGTIFHDPAESDFVASISYSKKITFAQLMAMQRFWLWRCICLNVFDVSRPTYH